MFATHKGERGVMIGPVRLGLYLHHAIWVCDIQNQKADAMNILKKAIKLENKIELVADEDLKKDA